MAAASDLKAVILEMDDDVEASQLLYLESILTRLRQCPEANFSITFPFNLEGSDISGAPHFLIHVLNGQCCLRLAGGDDLLRAAWKPRADEHHNHGIQYGRVSYAYGIAYKLEGLPKTSPYVQLDKPIESLNASDLLYALRVFLLVDIMEL